MLKKLLDISQDFGDFMYDVGLKLFEKHWKYITRNY